MLNPPENKPQPRVTQQFLGAVGNTAKAAKRQIVKERDLVIAVLFLIMGFLMGHM